MMKKVLILYLIFLQFLFLSCKTASEEDNLVKTNHILLNKALNELDFDWELHESNSYKIYTLKNSFASKNIQHTQIYAEDALLEVSERISLEFKEQIKINLLLLEDRGQMEKTTGWAARGWTEAKENLIILVQNEESNGAFKHELGHLFSWKTWGATQNYWLSEGFAVYAAGVCEGSSIDAWALAFKNENMLLSLNELATDFDFSQAAPHLQAGSLVNFIVDRYGTNSIEILWNSNLDSMEETIGINPVQLEKEWLAHISSPKIEKQAQNLKIKKRLSCE